MSDNKINKEDKLPQKQNKIQTRKEFVLYKKLIFDYFFFNKIK